MAFDVFRRTRETVPCTRLRVCAALRAEAERLVTPRRREIVRIVREIVRDDAAPRPSRFSAPSVARARRRDTFRRPPATRDDSRCAWRFIFDDPRFGGRNRTPARRAFDKPMAIACRDERAPCFPSRM